MKTKYIIFERGNLNKHLTGVQLFEKGIVSGLQAKNGTSIKVIRAPEFLKSTYGRLIYEQIWIPIYLNFIGRPYSISLLNSFPILYSKNIITIHDLAPLKGNWYNNWKYSFYYKKLLPKLIRRAKKIITVSDFSKDEIQTYFSVEDERIIVLGNSLSFTKDEVKKSNEIYSDKIFNGKYILTVGSLDPRKNIDKVIKGFISAQLEGYTLIIIGGSNKIFNYEPSKFRKDILFKGYMGKSELINYYKYCDLFINLSSYEGFGVPILEALYFNKTVIASNIPVYKELFRKSLIYVNQFDEAEVGLKIRKAIATKKKYANIEEDFFNKFSWSSLAKKLLEEL